MRGGVGPIGSCCYGISWDVTPGLVPWGGPQADDNQYDTTVSSQQKGGREGSLECKSRGSSGILQGHGAQLSRGACMQEALCCTEVQRNISVSMEAVYSCIQT